MGVLTESSAHRNSCPADRKIISHDRKLDSLGFESELEQRREETMTVADIVIRNATIYTIDANNTRAEAVAIEGEKIVHVGDNTSIEPLIGPDTRVIEAAGKMVLPGFIESHAHPILASYYLSGMILDAEHDLEQVLETVRSHIAQNPDRDSYFGLGYLETIFGPGGARRELLDEICSDKPVYLVSGTGHEAWVNSKALEVAGVDENTPDPIPGFQYFQRDEDGVPTGHVIESAPQMMVLERVRPFIGTKKLLAQILSDYSAMGVTSIVDCGVLSFMEDEIFEIVEGMRQAGELPCRILGCKFIVERGDIEGALDQLKGFNAKYDHDRFRIKTYKVLTDGTIESRSAAFSEPYSDTGTTAETLMTPEELKQRILDAAREGFDIHLHTVGDRAMHDALMAAKSLRETGDEVTRVTIAHCNYSQPGDRALFGKYGVIIQTSGAFFCWRQDWVDALGDREREQFTVKTYLDNGAKVTLGSDFPIDELGPEPVKAIEMVTTRQPFGQRDAKVLEPVSERLTIDQAIRAYTIDGAYQERMEGKIGSIEVGKYADMVVLGQNIHDVDTYDIHKIPVEMTIANGKIVYTRE